MAKAAVAAKVDGHMTDLRRPLDRDVQLEIVTVDSPDGLEVLRHSTAHLMAQAIRRLYPETKLAIGPVVGERFYYDIDCPKSLTTEDFAAIEKEMAKIVGENLAIEREEIWQRGSRGALPVDGGALQARNPRGARRRADLALPSGGVRRLVPGPHVPWTGYIKAFKLLSRGAGPTGEATAAGRCCSAIYGTAFPKQRELEAYLHRLEEAARRDHRRLGPALGLYTFHEESPGFPYWQPKGQILIAPWKTSPGSSRRRRGYLEVATPWISRSKLWEQSGHWYHYKENMFCHGIRGGDLGRQADELPQSLPHV